MQALTTHLVALICDNGFGGVEGLWPSLRDQPVALAGIVRMLWEHETFSDASYLLGELAQKSQANVQEQQLLVEAGIVNGLLKSLFRRENALDSSHNARLALSVLACTMEEARQGLGEAPRAVSWIVQELRSRLKELPDLAKKMLS